MEGGFLSHLTYFKCVKKSQADSLLLTFSFKVLDVYPTLYTTRERGKVAILPVPMAA